MTHEPKIDVFMGGDHINYKFIDEKHQQDKFNMNRVAITMLHISPWTGWCLLLDKLSMLHMNLEDCFVHMGGHLHNYKLLKEKHEQQDEFILSRLGNLQVGAYYKF